MGIVYNFHHGHGHWADFSKCLELMKPHLLCINLNGMSGSANFQKILPIGQGRNEEAMMKAMLESGYKGPLESLDT